MMLILTESKMKIKPFELKPMLPPLVKFFRYSGSLTTPGCFESVTWTVFEESVKISQTQVYYLMVIPWPLRVYVKQRFYNSINICKHSMKNFLNCLQLCLGL